METDDSSQQAEIRHLLQQQETPAIPTDVANRIQQALHAEQTQRHQTPRRRWLLPLGAAAALAILAGVVLLPGGSQPEPQPVADDCARFVRTLNQEVVRGLAQQPLMASDGA